MGRIAFRDASVKAADSQDRPDRTAVDETATLAGVSVGRLVKERTQRAAAEKMADASLIDAECQAH